MHEINSRDNQSQLMEWLQIKGKRYWISCNCHKGKSITPKLAATPIVKGYLISHKSWLHLL